MKVSIDTNIILDIALDREPFFADIDRILSCVIPHPGLRTPLLSLFTAAIATTLALNEGFIKGVSNPDLVLNYD